MTGQRSVSSSVMNNRPVDVGVSCYSLYSYSEGFMLSGFTCSLQLHCVLSCASCLVLKECCFCLLSTTLIRLTCSDAPLLSPLMCCICAVNRLPPPCGFESPRSPLSGHGVPFILPQSYHSISVLFSLHFSGLLPALNHPCPL